MTSAVAAALTAERSRAQVLLAALTADLAAIFAATEGANTDDEHDPEGSTIAFERSQLSVVIDDTRRRLAAIDAALTRLSLGSYGVCETCGRPIGSVRLQARPTSVQCLDCAARGARHGQARRNPAR